MHEGFSQCAAAGEQTGDAVDADADAPYATPPYHADTRLLITLRR